MEIFTGANDFSLPKLGLGTYKLKGESGARSVLSGIEAGYRLIDTAYNYENEGAVGEGIRRGVDHGVPREEIIVTSKLPGRYQQEAAHTVEESLFRLGLDYIDLYLIHWPNPKQGHYVEAYRGLMEARDKGLIRHVGVCNFLPEHLETIREATGELPVVNQIELHPYFPQLDALEYHRKHGIITQAWSPLARGDVFEQAPIVDAAEAHDASPAQVVLAWHRAIGALAIPKASSRERQEQNLRSLTIDLTDDEVAAISALGRPDGRRKDQDPAEYEEF